MVCFADQATLSAKSLVEDLTHHASISDLAHSAYAIPDDALPLIRSIEMLDFLVAQTDSARDRSNLIAPALRRGSVERESWSADGASDLEHEFAYLLSRYQQGIPKIASELWQAQQNLSVSRLRVRTDAVPQLSDFALPGLPSGCIVSTIFNQWVGVDEENFSWEVDGRLFFHPAHSYESQIVGFLHERVYSILRQSLLTPDSFADGVYFFVWTTLNSRGTYRDAAKFYNDLFMETDPLAGDHHITPLDFTPQIWFRQFFSQLLAAGPGAYDGEYRQVLLATPLLDQKIKDDADRAIRKFLKKGEYPADAWIQGWPADFDGSALPQPISSIR